LFRAKYFWTRDSLKTVSVVALNLEFVEFHGELLDKSFKWIIVFLQQLNCNLLCKHLAYIFLRVLEIWEKQDEHFFLAARNFYEVDFAADLMEIPVKDFSFFFNAEFVVAYF